MFRVHSLQIVRFLWTLHSASPSPRFYSERLCVHLLDKWLHTANRPVNYSVRRGWIHPQVSHSILKSNTWRMDDDNYVCAWHAPLYHWICVCVLWSGLGSWGRWWMTSYTSSATMTLHQGKATTLTGLCENFYINLCCRKKKQSMCFKKYTMCKENALGYNKTRQKEKMKKYKGLIAKLCCWLF